jgi:hypothetical protein
MDLVMFLAAQDVAISLVGLLALACFIYGIVLIVHGQVLGGVLLIVLALILGGGGVTYR